MNRFLAVLAVALLFPLFCLAQDGFQDVIYLKKGGFVKGFIVEQIPHKSVKILLQDGMVASFKVEEIEKFSKERFVDEPVDKRPRRSYVGSTVGLSMPIGSYANKSDAAATLGMHINMVQVGYMVAPNWGISISNYFAINDYKPNTNPIYINGGLDGYKCNVESYDGAMIGPLYSYPIRKKLNLDLRIIGGYTKFSVKGKRLYSYPWIGQEGMVTYSEDVYAVSFGAGAIFRYNLFSFLSVMACAEYFGCNPDLAIAGHSSYRQPVHTMSLGVGVAYRIQSINLERVLPFICM